MFGRYFARDLASFAATAVGFMLLDLLWLGLIARDFYAAQLGPLLRPSTFWPAALAFYGLYLGAVWQVAVRSTTSTTQAVRRGGGLGAFGYGVYELTNWAVLAGWPAMLVPVDWAWGAFLTAAAAGVGHSVKERVASLC